jgi:hypothetical protein
MSKENNYDKELLAKLRQARALLDECVAGLEGQPPRKAEKDNRRASAAGDSPTTLPGHILKLRDGGFFKQSKAPTEVHKKLNPIYECEFDRVAMALLRLQRRKQLRKSSKKAGKRQLAAYVW